jgi:hypothetical protein
MPILFILVLMVKGEGNFPGKIGYQDQGPYPGIMADGTQYPVAGIEGKNVFVLGVKLNGTKWLGADIEETALQGVIRGYQPFGTIVVGYIKVIV